MKTRPRPDRWSKYLIGLVQSAPLPESADDAAKLLTAAGLFLIGENLADLVALLREVVQEDQRKDAERQRQMATGGVS
jgi:hypothetical protein